MISNLPKYTSDRKIEMLRKRMWYKDGIFVERLQTAMEKRGIKLSDLVHAGVVSNGIMRNYVVRNGMPTGYVMQKLCSSMGISADYLLGLKDEDTPCS